MEHGKRTRARRTGPARISSKNQVTLPAAVLRTLGLHPGDLVDIAEEGGQIVIRRHRSRLDRVIGTIPGFTEAVDVEASRESWR
ncbi:AbrB/MazE/SpoVT family DNA-binding domain-containing protein [Streptosporangium sp. NBC_01755]|uniref:AbrB/MazE/SpoVT family DNA-binding domain-containing protein n=1 Tax=unclassified Streptosporangium TaxID=2632669 RepID=UPI002DDC79F4|nr:MULTISPECIES: AbrB/MazE/SpoVT family DNA-binding domain-containing protein [unclassified Streptosporangium]WSA23228.1 AbrB/MazE/SpoVT family DNA-binding domain-containing protein [Streptosporangium sp. NBC_01810]WSC98634.1 AbrB/MazE/SpoVT family DNA-binding domain-containing protein [Streptosporangium sp. NBC_01755]